MSCSIPKSGISSKLRVRVLAVERYECTLVFLIHCSPCQDSCNAHASCCSLVVCGRYMFAHTDDVICLAMHPDGVHVATGQMGKRPTIVVWRCDTMQVVSTLQGLHQRAVCQLAFSSDGRCGSYVHACILVSSYVTGSAHLYPHRVFARMCAAFT